MIQNEKGNNKLEFYKKNGKIVTYYGHFEHIVDYEVLNYLSHNLILPCHLSFTDMIAQEINHVVKGLTSKSIVVTEKSGFYLENGSKRRDITLGNRLYKVNVYHLDNYDVLQRISVSPIYSLVDHNGYKVLLEVPKYVARNNPGDYYLLRTNSYKGDIASLNGQICEEIECSELYVRSPQRYILHEKSK